MVNLNNLGFNLDDDLENPMNNNLELDFLCPDRDNLIADILRDLQICSNYYDEDGFFDLYRNSDNLLILSYNICSLPSKFQRLKIFLSLIKENNFKVDIILLQEAYQFAPGTHHLDGYNFYYDIRPSPARGGGDCYLCE